LRSRHGRGSSSTHVGGRCRPEQPAARWAQAALGRSWIGLIERVLAGQKDEAEIAASEVEEAVALIR
jgi:hypothetical protein